MPKIILNIINCEYWDFFSTLLAILVGTFSTWLFSKHYYNKANEYFRTLNEIYSKEISRLSKGKFEIKHDKKGMPIKIVYISLSGALSLKGNLTTRKIEADDKDN